MVWFKVKWLECGLVGWLMGFIGVGEVVDIIIFCVIVVFVVGIISFG